VVSDVALGLICRDGEKSLGACLDSVRPYVAQIVVGVDELTTDATERVALDAGADVVQRIAVSFPHTCEHHGTVMAQHFSQARNTVFGMLDRKHRWLMWLDADDVLEGGEHLAAFLESRPPATNCIWLPYRYATAQNGAIVSTVFDRERLLRSDLPWEWKNRVHEVVTSPVPLVPERTERIFVRHQEGVHKRQDSVQRNHLLLEIDLEEDPNDRRAVFYLANGYFAAGNMRASIETYQRLLELGAANPYDGWHAACYMGLAHMRLGEVEQAKAALHMALDQNPRHPQPYLYLARAKNMEGKWDEALLWSRAAQDKELPPSFAFVNPMDYTYNAYLDEAAAHMHLGQVGQALALYERALKIVPDSPEVVQAHQQAQQYVKSTRVAQAAVDILRELSDQEIVETELPLMPEAWSYGRIHDVRTPAFLRLRRGSTPRIIFLCGRALEPWAPPILREKGIGGSETAVVKIAERFVRDGWAVDVFGQPGKWEGVHDGAGWWDARFAAGERADVTVVWRQPGMPVPEGTTPILWLHDYSYRGHDLSRWPTVLGVSAYHAQTLNAIHKVNHADFVPNGIDLERFTGARIRRPFSALYTSSPDRGLEVLLDVWPAISTDEPGARLEIAYGWQNIDRAIAAGDEGLAALKGRVMRRVAQMKDTVTWLGRLDQDTLAEKFLSTSVWLYPTTFLETSCIGAMEAMAAGCIPVTTDAGALGDLVDGAGVVVRGPDGARAMPTSHPWRTYYAAVARGTMATPDWREPLRQKGRDRAAMYTWDASYERWKRIVHEKMGVSA